MTIDVDVVYITGNTVTWITEHNNDSFISIKNQLLVIIHDFISATHASIRDMAFTIILIKHDTNLCVIRVEVDT